MSNRNTAPIFLLLTLTLLITGGCDDDATTPDADGAISGLVVDDQGRPVAGAAILLSYDVEDKVLSGDKSGFVLVFEIQTPGHVHLWIAEACQGQMVRTLVDDELSAGRHRVVWDGDDAAGIRQVSGLYVANLDWDGMIQPMEVLMNRESYAQYLTAEGLDSFAVTDEDGRFRIDQDCLALGRGTNAQAEDGSVFPVTVSRNVTVWAIHETFGAARSALALTVDPENGAFATISFGELSKVRSFAANHWIEDRLECAFDPACTDPFELVGLGDLYFAVGNYQNLPLWISQEDDEEEFLENIGRWNQFVFGWDDFVHPSVFMGDDYEFGDPAVLNDPRISANREIYRAMMGMTTVE